MFSIISKLILLIVKIFKKGAGSSLPGYIVLKIFPEIVSKIKYPHGIILISGTNGKTTTSKIITHLLSKSGLKVVSNSTGANLIRGVISSFLLNTTIFGKPKGDIGVFEVDELALPSLLKSITPRAVVLLNLSRDQLDRYGEPDIIFNKWISAFSSLDEPTILIADSGQPEFKEITKSFKGRIFFFDVSPNLLEKTNLQGSFNAKNIDASMLTLEKLGFDRSLLETYLSGFSVAYGRGETISISDRNYTLFLAKNPESFNENLRMILSGKASYDSLLFVLNDGIPDGRDVSWIYDVNAELLFKTCEKKKIFVSGTRAWDMSVRLSYAGIYPENSNINLKLKDILKKISPGNILVLPNYSAMLETREILLGRKIL